MIWDTIFFVLWPYISMTLFVGVTLYRSVVKPFTVSSLSTQLLESKKLYWGNIAFHYGVVLVLIGHLIALAIPKSVVLWNSVPLRLYLLEITGLALGLWALVGLLILIYRRITDRKIMVVTTWMDWVVLVTVLVSVLTGVLTASLYRFGSFWFTGVFTPYLRSLVFLQPRLDLVSPLPWIIKLHVINNFLLAAIFPFSRLVHIFTYPISYLIRPWQIVIWNRKIRPERGR